MDGAKRRVPGAIRALMAIVLVSTLAFPYAALAADTPATEVESETQGKQMLSDSDADTNADDGGGGQGSNEIPDRTSQPGTVDEGAPVGGEAEPAISEEAVPADHAAEEATAASAEPLSEAELLADHSVSTEQELRDALAAATANSDKAVSIEVTSDIQLTSTIMIALKANNQVTIESVGGASLLAAPNARHFLLLNSGDASSTECLLFSNIVLDGAQSGGGILFLPSAAPYFVNAIPGDDGSSTGYSLTITNCTAANGGAMLASSGAQLELFNLQLTGNSADTWGGAIYGEDGASVNLYQSPVVNNHAAVAGGGMYIGAPVDAWDDNVFSGKTSFESNTAPNGGAIYAEGNVRAAASTFRLNSATYAGGAVYVQAPEAMIAFNECGDDGTPTEFDQNEAGEHGGALYASVDAAGGELNVSVNHTLFTLSLIHI